MDDAEPQSTEANARLIAAAPEMVSLLEDYEEAVSEMKLDDWLSRRDAILRRIKGEEQD